MSINEKREHLRIWAKAKRKKNRRLGRRNNPPKTRRICLGCKKETTWKYHRLIGHSRCLICGESFSKPIKSEI